MSRSHKIWIDVSGGTGKSFGVGTDKNIKLSVKVGSSASYSEQLAKIEIGHFERDGITYFYLNVDGKELNTATFDKKTKEFTGIPEEKEEDQSSMLNAIANVARMSEFFTDTKEQANDWKTRMLKAGLSNKGLIMPEDWDTLSEDDKEKRLNGAIEILSK